MHTLRKDKQVF